MGGRLAGDVQRGGGKPRQEQPGRAGRVRQTGRRDTGCNTRWRIRAARRLSRIGTARLSRHSARPVISACAADRQRPRRMENLERRGGQVHADCVYTTRIFRFEDKVRIVITPSSESTCFRDRGIGAPGSDYWSISFPATSAPISAYQGIPPGHSNRASMRSIRNRRTGPTGRSPRNDQKGRGNRRAGKSPGERTDRARLDRSQGRRRGSGCMRRLEMMSANFETEAKIDDEADKMARSCPQGSARRRDPPAAHDPAATGRKIWLHAIAGCGKKSSSAKSNSPMDRTLHKRWLPSSIFSP